MLTSILVDDEESACKALNTIIDTYFSTQIRVIGIAHSCLEAAGLINQHQPDVVFLDISMPKGSGFDLFEYFPDPSFQVVFITAYNQYAIDAIKVSAKDYLLKPIDIDELGKTINKLHRESFNMLESIQQKKKSLKLPTQNGFAIIQLENIIYCEAENNYTVFHLKNGNQHVVSKTMKEYEDILCKPQFIRIHRSHIVQTNQIEEYQKGSGGSVIVSNGAILPVSKSRKEELLDLLI